MVKNIPKDIIVIIPARGGSKRILRKNMVPVGGLPLVAHSILHAKAAKFVKQVYVSTDDKKIAKISGKYGAEVIDRPKRIANDQATSESALLHVLDYLKSQGKSDPGLVVFLQATSPLRKRDDIDNAINKLIAQKADSLFSACRDLGLMWKETGNKIQSINYNYHTRKRDQDMGVQYRENGSVYVFKPKILRKHNNRLGGKVAVYEMDTFHSFQIDSREDIKFIEILQILTKPGDSKPLPDDVQLVVFDFDGVFTDNRVKTDRQGNEFVTNSRADSLGLSFLRKTGIPAIVLSTEKHPVVAARCKKLKLPCYQGIGDKKKFLTKYLKSNKIDPKSVVYVGNDINDLECFQVVGFTAAPADSDPRVIMEADYVLGHRGGNGAVREVCELIVEKYAR